MSANPNGSDMSRTERHEWVCLLKEQGHSFTEIAALMGVARSTVTSAYYDPSGEQDRARKEKYCGTCVDCGARTTYLSDGSTAERCTKCDQAIRRTMEHRRASADRNIGRVKWTDEDIFAAIRSIAVDGKATCTAYDDAERNGRKGSLPTRSGIVFRFGSWRNAVHAAGLVTSRESQPTVYANRMSDEGLLCALEDCAAELGHWPAANEYEKWCVGGRGPSIGIVRQRFGQWITALETAMARHGGKVPA